jgi:hypothetical protein
MNRALNILYMGRVYTKMNLRSFLNGEAQSTESRVSFETSFDSKQPKLDSALSETKRLFRLFHVCTETESFDVSIE